MGETATPSKRSCHELVRGPHVLRVCMCVCGCVELLEIRDREHRIVTTAKETGGQRGAIDRREAERAIYGRHQPRDDQNSSGLMSERVNAC